MHRAASHQMQMQMMHRLSAIDSCVYHDSKSLCQILLLRQLRCN